MVGEIRDQATASMAIRASLTGHLVLSTIHTNWSWGIVARLMDMDIPSYLLADTLNSAVAQRLVRLLCPNCKEEVRLLLPNYPPRYKPPMDLPTHFMARGCEQCFYTGFQGRKAIYEVITVDRELAELIKEGKLNVIDALREKGFKSLADNAFCLLAEGVTSVEEVYPILAGG
jgi:general secretion pathway protein E/type IV pilus assembly protein PilB